MVSVGMSVTLLSTHPAQCLVHRSRVRSRGRSQSLRLVMVSLVMVSISPSEAQVRGARGEDFRRSCAERSLLLVAAEEARVRTVWGRGHCTTKTADSDDLSAAGDVVGTLSPVLAAPVEVSMAGGSSPDAQAIDAASATDNGSSSSDSEVVGLAKQRHIVRL